MIIFILKDFCDVDFRVGVTTPTIDTFWYLPNFDYDERLSGYSKALGALRLLNQMVVVESRSIKFSHTRDAQRAIYFNNVFAINSISWNLLKYAKI